MKKLMIFLGLFFGVAFGQSSYEKLLESIKNRSPLERADSLLQYCWNNRDTEPDLSLKAADKALAIADSIDAKNKVAQALNYLSVIYRDQGAYEKSLGLSTHGLQIASETKDLDEVAYSYNNISTIYRLMGNYPAAIEKLYEALKIFENTDNKVGIGYCYYNLGFVYLRQENYQKALENFEATVRIRKKLNDFEGKTKAEGRIAEIYLHEGFNEKALSLFRKVEKAYKDLKDQRSLINIRMGLAEIFQRRNDIQGALKERKDALELSEKFNDVMGIVANYSKLGVLYAMSNNFEIAKKYLQLGSDIANKFNSSELKLTNYKSYVDYFEIKKDYINAFKYSKLLREFQDSISHKEKATAISEVEAAYRISKKEKEKELIQKDLEKQQQQVKYYILISILLVGLSVVVIILYLFKRRTSFKLDELNRTKDKLFNIIAHNLKNSFNVLLGYSDILKEEGDDLSEEEKRQFIDGLVSTSRQTHRLLENLLYWSRSQTNKIVITIEKLNLNAIIQESLPLLEEQAKQKNVNIYTSIPEQCLVLADSDMLKTLLRNLISNGVKYSFQNSSLNITVHFKDKECNISIADEGVGVPEDKKSKLFGLDNVKSVNGTAGERGTGLGLILCKEFVTKMNGRIWIEDNQPKGSRFIFTLPVAE